MNDGSSSTLNVLVLEGNPVTRSVLSRVVEDSFSDTVQLVAASSVAAARREIADAAGVEATGHAGPFQLIVIDLELPETGALAWLRSLADHAAIKVVTTLHSDDEHLFPALQSGADGYLLKEDRFEALVEALQKIVRGQPPLSPALARRMLMHFKQRAEEQPATAPTQGLAQEEQELLMHLSKGFTVKEIANSMGLKGLTVNQHIRRIYKKLDDARPPLPGASHGRHD